MVIYENNLNIIVEIANMLKNGKVGAIATDTVYGLVCDAKNENAIDKIYQLKKRSKNKSFVVFSRNIEDFNKIIDVNSALGRIADKFLPGALTILAKKNNNFKQEISSKVSKNEYIGIRIPKDEFFLKLLEKFSGFLIVTSANISNKPPALNLIDLKSYFNNDLDFIIKGSGFSSEVSTIIKLDDFNDLEIIRQGAVSKKEILKYL